MGIRISKCFFFTFKGIRISECFLEFFYGDQNFLILAWVFFLGGGAEITNLTIKKCQKNFVGHLRCFTEYEKSHV